MGGLTKTTRVIEAYGSDYSAREFSPGEINEVWHNGIKYPISFVWRYIGYPANRKCISYYPGAYQRFRNAGKFVGLFHQIAYNDFEGGYAKGRLHGQTALADARSSRVGWDGESPILACLDRFKVKAGYATLSDNDIDEYLRGFVSVVGEMAGFYGFYDSMAEVVRRGRVKYFMQCGAKSALIDGVQLWQQNNFQPVLLGTATDLLESYVPLSYLQGDDDVSAQDVWNHEIPRTPDEIDKRTTAPTGQLLRYANEMIREAKDVAYETNSKVDKLIQLVASLISDPDLDEEALRALLEASEKRQVEAVTAGLRAGLAPVLAEALRSVAEARDDVLAGQIARESLERMGEILSAKIPTQKENS